jgi:hypothetical protein
MTLKMIKRKRPSCVEDVFGTRARRSIVVRAQSQVNTHADSIQSLFITLFVTRLCDIPSDLKSHLSSAQHLGPRNWRNSSASNDSATGVNAERWRHTNNTLRLHNKHAITWTPVLDPI